MFKAFTEMPVRADCVKGEINHEKPAGLPDSHSDCSASWLCAILSAATYRGKDQDADGWDAQKTDRYL